MVKSTQTSVTEQEKSELVRKLSQPISVDDKEAQKKEVMRELMSEMGAKEVIFKRTSIQDSERFAQILNDSPKKMTMWELDEGEKRGTLEPVTINGARGLVPKGVAVLVPEQVAAMIEGYKIAEATAGDNVLNMSGGLGINADRDAATKSALGL